MYVVASSQEEAEGLLKREEGGLCGDCMCELLVDTQAEVSLMPELEIYEADGVTVYAEPMQVFGEDILPRWRSYKYKA